MNNSTGKTRWFDLPVSDLGRAMTFYQALFGWKFQTITGTSLPPYAMIEAGGELIGGLRQDPAAGAPAGGAVVYFTVDNLASAMARALQLGGEKAGETVDLGNRRGAFQWMRDPGKTLFAIWGKS